MFKLSNVYAKTTLAASASTALLLCVACTATKDQDPVADSGTMAANPDSATPVKQMSPQQQIAFARHDLASRLGLEPEAIMVSGVNSVTWRSGAVGCPKPGQAYTDVLVPGIWILLRVEKAVYRYHGIPGNQPFYCPEEWAQGPVVGPGAD